MGNMKANARHNDFVGSAAAEIAKSFEKWNFESLNSFFNVNTDRFKIIGISINGTKNFSISLLCIDKSKTTSEKEHIVKIMYDIENTKNILPLIFNSFNVILYEKHNDKYQDLNWNEEILYEDVHQSEEKE